jgi:uncharacterized membrane protein YgaE (UPF0421/DUF939 family)
MLELVLEIIVGVVSAISAWRLLLSFSIGVILALLMNRIFSDHDIAVGAGLAVVCVSALVGMRWQRIHEKKNRQHPE